MIKLFNKWILLNKNRYNIISKDLYTFNLSEKQQKKVDKLLQEKGKLEYRFKYSGIGIITHVTILNTGETIDITDYDSW